MTASRWTAFLILAVLATVALFPVDQTVARFAASADPGLLSFFRFVTWFGQGGVVLIPAGIVLLAALWLRPRLPSLADPLRRLVGASARLFVAVAVAGLVNDGLKLLFSRGRPRVWLHGGAAGFFSGHFGSDYQSFPSGHTATSVAAAVVLASLFPRWRGAFALFALAIAVSRVGLDAHYLSDVVAAAAVGATCAILVLAWFRRRGWPAARLEGDRPPA